MTVPASIRKAQILPESLHQRLTSYALVAGATGVGMLAMMQPANAKVVYTPTHVVLPFGPTYIFFHDKFDDLVLFKVHETITANIGTAVGIYPTGGVPWIGPNGVNDLKAGFKIGPKDTFSSKGGEMAAGFWYKDGGGFYRGRWANGGAGAKRRYAGLKFTVSDKTYYGWARFNICFPHHSVRAILTGYAYETIPNKPIIAGKTTGKDVITVHPGSLGHLASGTAGR